MSWKVFAVVPILLFASLSARAEGPTLRFNNPGTVITAPTDVSMDLVMPGDADHQGVAAFAVIEYDPAKVTLSNPRAASPTLWNDFSTFWATADHQLRVLMLTDITQPGQTATGPLLYVTVTPVGASADLSVCATLRLVGGAWGQDYTSNLAVWRPSLSNWDSLWVPSSCGPLGPIYVPPGEDGATTDDGTTTADSLDGSDGDGGGASGISTTMESVKHILRYAAGLAAEPARFPSPLPFTEIESATMELTDTNYTMVPSPPEGCNIPTARQLTIADAILFLKIAFSYHADAVWSMDFLGNPQLGGNAANATGMPAIADIDGDSKLEAVFLMGLLDGTNYFNPRYTGNPNQVRVLKDLNDYGTYGLKLGTSNTPGFPQPLKDAPSGVAVANIVPPASGADYPEIVVSNFQDVADRNGHYLNDLYSRPYVFDSNGQGVDPFASADNPDSPYGLALGHGNSAPAVWDVDKNGKPEVFFPALGHYDKRDFHGTYGGSIQRLEATRQPDGTVTVSVHPIQETTENGKWLTEPDTPEMPGVPASSSHAEFQVPPVMIRTVLSDPNSDRIVAAVTGAGDVYGWNKNGDRVFYFQTDDIQQMVNGEQKDRGRAPCYNPIAAADVTGDGKSDLIVPTGKFLNYAQDCPDDPPDQAYWWDGFIYCYSPDASGAWRKVWRYPSSLVTDEFGRPGGYPSYASGVSVGRLLGPNHPPCVVAVGFNGRVVALDGTDGSELWTFDIPWNPSVPGSKAAHRYMNASVTQPLILDINGDGYEDVIVGTTSGWVWFLNGHPLGNQGAPLSGHPPIHTIRSADSTTIDHIVEPQYEEVRGLAVGPMKSTPNNPTDGQTRAILLVTSGRAGLVRPPQVGGHAFLFDLGAGSWNSNTASWPQFGQNAQRTGHYPGP